MWEMSVVDSVPFECLPVCSMAALWCQSTILVYFEPPLELWSRWGRAVQALPMGKPNFAETPTSCAAYPILFVQTSTLSVVRRVYQLLRYCKICSLYCGHWCDVSAVCRRSNWMFLEWNWYHNIWEMTLTMMTIQLMSTTMTWPQCLLSHQFVDYQFCAERSLLPDKMHDTFHRRLASIGASQALDQPHRTNVRHPTGYKLQKRQRD